jgi:hypothetical protein
MQLAYSQKFNAAVTRLVSCKPWHLQRVQALGVLPR